MLKRLDTKLIEPTNKNLIYITKVLKPVNKNISVINSPMYPPSLFTNEDDFPCLYNIYVQDKMIKYLCFLLVTAKKRLRTNCKPREDVNLLFIIINLNLETKTNAHTTSQKYYVINSNVFF